MYAKVFSQIYDGSLCTHGPWQALVTFQQMLILADQKGVVDMTADAISRRTTIPLDIIQTGIKALLQPDPHSRTPTEDGRRLLPLSESRDWGWRITNYEHYRELKREQDRREYHQAYWHKRKATQQSGVESVEGVETQPTQPNQPIAEAEAKADTEKKRNPPTPSKRGHEYSEKFTKFWETYPGGPNKRTDKPGSYRSWVKQGCEENFDEVMLGYDRAKRSKDWVAHDGKFVPMATTFLNQRRWEAFLDAEEDEYIDKPESLTTPPAESVDQYLARMKAEREANAARATPPPQNILDMVRRSVKVVP